MLTHVPVGIFLLLGFESFFLSYWSFLFGFMVQILLSVLEIAPFKFSIKLAAYASGKEHINLEKWLSENMDAYKDAFFEVISCAS